MFNFFRVSSSSKIFFLLLMASLIVSFRADIFGGPNLETAARPLMAAPTFTKVFSPDTIGPGNISTLTFTINNTGQPGATDLAFSDTLPTNVTIATPASASTTCTDGVVTASSGGSTITFSNGEVDPGDSCTVSVNVTSNTAETHTNTSGDLTSSAGNSGPATDDLTVDAAYPNFSKSFSPRTVSQGSRTTLTFLIANPGPDDFYYLYFADNLVRLEVANPANASTTCVGFSTTFTAEAGTSVVSFDVTGFPAPVLAAGATCTASVDVIATGGGQIDNTTEELEFNTVFLDPITTGGKAGAVLNVPNDTINLGKSFTDDPISAGGTGTLAFTITNFSRTDTATAITFSDNLDAALSGLTSITLLSNDCGGSIAGIGTGSIAMTGGGPLAPEAICTVNVAVQVPAGVTPGSYMNTSSIISATRGGLITGTVGRDALIIEPAPVLTKEFIDDPVIPGGDVTLRFTISNPSTTSGATNIAFLDELTTFLPFPITAVLPSDPCGAGSTMNIQHLGTDREGLSLTGGSLDPAPGATSSCTFDVTVTIPIGVGAGSYLNTTEEPSATIGGISYIGQPASDTLVVVGAPSLSKYFTSTVTAPGNTVNLVFELEHNAEVLTDATAITFSDDLAGFLSGVTATGLPQNNICGAGSSLTGSTGDTLLTFSNGSLSAGSSCTFTVTLQIPSNAAVGTHTNTSSDVSATVAGYATSNSGGTSDLIVTSSSLTKKFSGDPVIPGGTVTLEFTFDNTASAQDATSLTFTDDLTPLTIPSILVENDVCGLGSVLVGVGSSLTLSSGNVLAGASCTFSVTLQVPSGTAEAIYNNATSSPSVTIGTSPVSLLPAEDSLIVVKDVLEFSKTFVPNGAFAGDNVTLVFSMTNSFTSATASTIDFTDDLSTTVSGLSATGLPVGVCGGTLSGSTLLTFSGGTLNGGENCIFSVTLTIPGAATAGDYTNSTSQATGVISGLAVTGQAASDILSVIDSASSGQLLVDKVTDPAGDSTSFSFAVKGPAAFTPQSFNLADGDTPQVIAAPAGVYTISEIVPSSWTLTASSCSNGNAVDSITINAGAVVTCTFNSTSSSVLSGDIYLPIILKDVDVLPLPDLTVERVILTQVSGNTYNIAVTVRNQASVDVTPGNNFYINAYLTSDLNTPLVLCSVQATWFGAGQSYICNGQYTFGSGTHTVRGWADPYNTVLEADESNNTRDAGGVTITGLGQSLENKVTYPAGVLPTATPAP